MILSSEGSRSETDREASDEWIILPDPAPSAALTDPHRPVSVVGPVSTAKVSGWGRRSG